MGDIDKGTSWDYLVPPKSDWLTQADVGEAGKVLTIARFDRQMVQWPSGPKLETICYWVEQDSKPMVMNQTKTVDIQAATQAPSPDESLGQKVEVYADPQIMFGTDRTGGLRVRAPSVTPASSLDLPSGGSDGTPFDDDIPFGND